MLPTELTKLNEISD